jgi:hypothetical protein
MRVSHHPTVAASNEIYVLVLVTIVRDGLLHYTCENVSDQTVSIYFCISLTEYEVDRTISIDTKNKCENTHNMQRSKCYPKENFRMRPIE